MCLLRELRGGRGLSTIYHSLSSFWPWGKNFMWHREKQLRHRLIRKNLKRTTREFWTTTRLQQAFSNTNEHTWETFVQRFCFVFQSFIKEADLRSTEIKKAKRDFERRFLKPMKGSFLEVKEPEKVLQHIEDKSKVKSGFSQIISAHARKLFEQFLYPYTCFCFPKTDAPSSKQFLLLIHIFLHL